MAKMGCLGTLWSYKMQIIVVFLSIYIGLIARETLYILPTSPMQFLKETAYWAIFPIWTTTLGNQPIALDPEGIVDGSVNLELLEFDAKDPDGFENFMKYAGDPKYDHNIVILHNVFDYNRSASDIWKWGDEDYYRANTDLEKEYQSFYMTENYSGHRTMSMEETLSEMKKQDEALTYMGFNYELIRTQENLDREYTKFIESMPGMKKRTLESGIWNHHAMVYWGDKFRVWTHNAALADYIVQIANVKHWTFVHKRYIPYMSMMVGIIGNLGMFKWHEAYKIPEKVPRLDVMVGPGDLMYFGTWHIHRVFNVHPNQWGMAIGLRPDLVNSLFFKEAFWPLRIHNWVSSPAYVKQKLFGKPPTGGAAVGKGLSTKPPCCYKKNFPFCFVYNGTMMTQAHATFDEDGECILVGNPEY